MVRDDKDDKIPDLKDLLPKVKGISRGIMSAEDSQKRAEEEINAMKVDLNPETMRDMLHIFSHGLIARSDEVKQQDNPVEAGRAAAKAASTQTDEKTRRLQEEALKQLMAQQDAKKPGREV